MFSVRPILGYTHAFTLRRRGKSAGDSIIAMVDRLTRVMGVGRRVRVLISSMADTPSVVGWLRPVIVLPAATLMGLTPLQLEAVLAHELGHIKRYDYLVNILQILVETLLFYHPAVWWTSRRIRMERELCCDDLAVRFSGNALRYARALTTLEKLRLRTPGVAMASTGGPLLFRIQRLTGIAAKEYGPSRLPAVVALSLGILCFALNVNWIRAQDAPGVKVDLGSSTVIHRTPVTYPEAARKQRLTGTVQVEVKLDSAGNVVDAHVLSGPEELRKPALESVLNWHFTGDAARGTRLINISFSEQGKQVQVREPERPQAIAENLLVERDKQIYVAEVRKLKELEAARFNLLREPTVVEEEKTRNVLTRRQELERSIADAKKKIELAAQNQEQETVEQLKLKLLEMQNEFSRTPFEKPGPVVMAGRPVKRISADLPEPVRADLISRLPVREGDTLSPSLIEDTARAVRAFDEHLRVQVRATIDGQIELHIVAPR
jgi:TonB family protein